MTPSDSFMALCFSILAVLLVGCARTTAEQGAGEQGSAEAGSAPADSAAPTFADDLRFLEEHGAVQVLQASGGARVALSAGYQGRVMTSATGPEGRSLGWINRDFIASGETGTPFDNYGGEDRFWLGPEGGQYGLHFAPGDSFTFANWQVPAALGEGAWTIEQQSDTSVTYARAMQPTNYSGRTFEIEVERTVRLLSAEAAAQHFGAAVPEDADWVGFETVNRVTNVGDAAWTKEEGLPSIWILGMYEPFGTTYVAIPYEGEPSEDVVNDAYFGEVPADRLEVREGYVLFKCDGEERGKIGLGPGRAEGVMGSYNAEAGLMTLVQYNQPEGATSGYVNSMWEMQQAPYGGDAVNAYNDGPPAPGVPPLGGFYEMETSSPALDLAPGESYTHTQRTLHLTGDRAALAPLAQAALSISLDTLAQGIR